MFLIFIIAFSLIESSVSTTLLQQRSSTPICNTDKQTVPESVVRFMENERASKTTSLSAPDPNDPSSYYKNSMKLTFDPSADTKNKRTAGAYLIEALYSWAGTGLTNAQATPVIGMSGASTRWVFEFALKYSSGGSMSAIGKYGFYTDSSGQLKKFVVFTSLSETITGYAASGATCTAVSSYQVWCEKSVTSADQLYLYPVDSYPYVLRYTWVFSGLGSILFSSNNNHELMALMVSTEYYGTDSCTTFPGSSVTWTNMYAWWEGNYPAYLSFYYVYQYVTCGLGYVDATTSNITLIHA